MLTQSELKKKLFVELKKRPKINSFFRPMLIERTERLSWLENGLVLLLLRDAQSNLEMLECFLAKAESVSGELLQSMSQEYRGSSPDFDARLNDLLAELNALSWLVDNNYREIEKLPTPTELLDIVVKSLEIQFLQNPDRYSTFFRINVSSKESRRDFLDDTDKLNVCRLMAEIDDRIKSGKQEVQLRYTKMVGDRKITKKLKCEWGDAGKFGYMAHSGDFGICFSDPKRSLLLLPLIRKSWERTEYAVKQLIEYDKDDSYDKWILVNWQKPFDFIIDDALSQDYRNTFPNMDSILKYVNPKLHIRLL